MVYTLFSPFLLVPPFPTMWILCNLGGGGGKVVLQSFFKKKEKQKKEIFQKTQIFCIFLREVREL